MFRVYKGLEYRARAAKGQLFLEQTEQFYPSFHKLNQAVVPLNENAWQNWYFLDEKGERRLIMALRK